jgi:protein-tyrosine-phosphatase
VHPFAVKVAARHGLDLSRARTRGYADVRRQPDVVVSVCDRAAEAGIPFAADRLHWSVTDPAHGDEKQFEAAFVEIAERVSHLARMAA